ncbi:MAG TPA: heme-binding domain-containing protein [Chitinophagaceae bacterium]|nr:heme-binding domain-containing protein [Chitinophagaceae bacterium]
MLKKIGIFLLAALVILQFFHPAKNKDKGPRPNFIGNNFPIPAHVQTILEKACNDCHSNNTRYPWYSYTQPVDWWLDNHVKEGKRHLNFDEYTNKRLRYQYHKLEEIAEQVKENEMPLNSYTWMHRDARLTPEEKNTLIDWSDALRDSLKAKYPLDSLLRKNNPQNPPK